MTAPDRHSSGHVPVLLAEVIDALSLRDGGIYLDGTLGACGYAEAMLAAADCRVYGIDQDPDTIEKARETAKKWDGRLIPLHGRFGDMADLLKAEAVIAVDGIALDLGVSSMQIDEAARGFSFLRDGPLDMRMSRQGPSAADIVNEMPEAELADIIRRYGEERHARRIARAIAAARTEAPITTTLGLADIVRGAIPGARKASGIDPATRTFQALRIYVNDELGELERGLEAAEALLAPGGRLAVVSFHSLEDRIVKAFLRDRSGGSGGSRHLPEAAARPATFALLARRATTPGEAETSKNPRARSAKLRAAERLAAPDSVSAHPNPSPAGHPAAGNPSGDAR